MRIGVTGGRNFFGAFVILDALTPHVESGPHVLIYGGASGADELSANYASLLGWQLEKHAAKWNVYGKAAGPIRNREMVDSGLDLLLVFRQGNSRHGRNLPGTWDSDSVPWPPRGLAQW